MFCRNCGRELIGSPEFCPNCGARSMSGTSFCPGCGAPTTPLTEICPKCGARVTRKTEISRATWMPLTTGILDLVAGGIGFIVGAVTATIGGLATWVWHGAGAAYGVVVLILAIMAIVGGIYALRKRGWGLALAGSICALIAGILIISPPVIIFAIAAIVFTILGRPQFT